MYYMPDPVPAPFSPPSATISEVQIIIAAFPNKPSKINVLPVFVFKKLSYIIAPVICDIFNTSKNQGIFPSNLKLSRTVLIHKAKSYKLTNNFRPISLLPLMSEIIEKLMKNRATEFINNNSILYNNQFG